MRRHPLGTVVGFGVVVLLFWLTFRFVVITLRLAAVLFVAVALFALAAMVAMVARLAHR